MKITMFSTKKDDRQFFDRVNQQHFSTQGFVLHYQNVNLTEAQLQALEKVKDKREADGEIETHHPGYPGCQDTYYVGHIKGIGKIYQQTFIDTCSWVAMAKGLYGEKRPDGSRHAQRPGTAVV